MANQYINQSEKIKLDNPTSPFSFRELKEKIKAECARRQYISPIDPQFSTYEYEEEPEIGKKINKDVFNKNINALNAIAPTGYT